MINVVCYKVRQSNDDPAISSEGIQTWLEEHVGEKDVDWRWNWMSGTPYLGIIFSEEHADTAIIFKLIFGI